MGISEEVCIYEANKIKIFYYSRRNEYFGFIQKELGVHKNPKGWKRQCASVNVLQESTSLNHMGKKDVIKPFMSVCFFVLYNDAKSTFS